MFMFVSAKRVTVYTLHVKQMLLDCLLFLLEDLMSIRRLQAPISAGIRSKIADDSG